MAVLLLLAALLQEPVSSTLYGSRFLMGEVGGSVTHQCFYSITTANKHDRKYWCKIARSGVCYTVISTTGYTSTHHMGRVSLQDIPQDGTFAVTLTELKMNDTGIYRCGIGTSNRDLYVGLNLTVSEDAISPSGTIELIRGELRGSVMVLCPPGDTQGSEKRFWCKLGRTSCALIADSDGYVGRNYQGRILITPQKSSGAFKILINDLKKEDMGLYKCGTGRLSGWDSQPMVALQVTAASTLPRRPKFPISTVGGSFSFQCHYDPKGNYEKKYLCRWKDARCSLLVDTEGFVHELYKGRIQIASSQQENGIYTVVMRHLREEDEGWYWCGAKNGHTEHTSAVMLLIKKERSSSQDPETSTLVKPTLSSSLAAYSTPTQRSVTSLTYAMGTIAKSTSTLLPTVPPGTSGTSPGEIYDERGWLGAALTPLTPAMATIPRRAKGFASLAQSSNSIYTVFARRHHIDTLQQQESLQLAKKDSSGESPLLPVVLPALILPIFITITILALIKIKFQKERGEESSAAGNLEAARTRSDLNPMKEQRMEETPSPEKAQDAGQPLANVGG